MSTKKSKTASSATKKKKKSSAFEKATKADVWKSPSGQIYSLRFPRGLDVSREGLPRFTLWNSVLESEQTVIVCGGVWSTGETNNFVGFWAEDEGDGHVDLFVRDDYDNKAELDLVTTALSSSIHPELRDWLDDGSGGGREGIPVAASLFDDSLMLEEFSYH